MRWLFSLVLMALCLGFWLWLVDMSQVNRLIVQVRWFWLLIAAGLGLIHSGIGALRVQRLCSLKKPLSVCYVWAATQAAMLVSSFLPVHLGGFGLAYLLAKELKTTYLKVLSLLVLDFVATFFLPSILAVWGLWYFGQKHLLRLQLEPARLADWLFWGMLVVIGVGVASLTGRLGKRLRNLAGPVVGYIISAKFLVMQVVVMALAMNLISFTQFYLYFWAFGLQPEVFELVFASQLLALLGLLPGVPAKLGQYEVIGIVTLPYLLSLDRNAVSAVLVASHGISLITSLVLGGIGMYFLGTKRLLFLGKNVQ